jgi:hypothetical protein
MLSRVDRRKPQQRLDTRSALERTSSNTKVAGLEYHSPGKAWEKHKSKVQPKGAPGSPVHESFVAQHDLCNLPVI